MKRLIFVACFFYSHGFAQEIPLNSWFFFAGEANKNASKTVKIPHTWNDKDAFDDQSGYYRGQSTYSTTYQYVKSKTKGKKHYIHFDGINQKATLFINNKEVGTHKGGYTAFSWDIESFLKKGNNSIKVEVDNLHDEAIPPLDADFTFYGGMYRKASIQLENMVHFTKRNGTDDLAVKLTKKSKSKWNLKLDGSFQNADKRDIELLIQLFNQQGQMIHEKATYMAGEGIFSVNNAIYDPNTWSPNKPKLYKLKVQLRDTEGEVFDKWEQKIGFRTIEASGEGFKINGDPLKLIGVNRHQDWENKGNALSDDLHLEDLAAIKEMGSNFLRLAHYPQSKKVYEIADSLGLILWSEIPVVNKVPINDAYKAYEDNALRMQQEHIAQVANHPSVVFIGYMNEIFMRMTSDEKDQAKKDKIINKTVGLAQKLENLTRISAPNQLTVMALHGNQIYNETKIADIPMVVGWNLYYGWYGGGIEDLGVFLDEEHKKYPNRPMIVSEYGVGADVRLHNDKPEKFDFSEEYQLPYHLGYVRQIASRPFIMGMATWNFSDFGSEFRGNTIPHINQKGLVNFDRTPKNIYYWYQAVLRPKRSLSRIYRDHPVWYHDANQKLIKVISNRPITIWNNKKSLGNFTPEESLIQTAITLLPGSNTIELRDEEDRVLDTYVMQWVKSDFKKMDYLAINFGTDSYFVDDKKTYWIPTGHMERLSITGSTKKVSTDKNIKKTESDPIYQTGITGVNEIRIPIPSGKYELTLCLTRYDQAKKESNSKATIQNNEESIEVNGKKIKLPVLQPNTKNEVEVEVKSSGIVTIKSHKNNTFVFSGIKIKK